ncbi:MAG TPA: asparagine synthase (glutamine-hydrolyzing), partial [Burkholderiaceae bacterium]|nr:asparagine synthase (glutamine-hydrolyzing) [Burkholderiaceae bacterium]
ARESEGDPWQWWSGDGRVGLAHRRLSILELSPMGHQPMHSQDGQLSVVYNGEIYNHEALRQTLAAKGYVFRSHSDTEVLLAAYGAWGDDCLTQLNGMFAFAIYDARQATLFLARDRAGEKPLFYRLDQGTLRFASELKALLAEPGAPRQIDPSALDCYLAMGFVPGPHCMLQGYSKLPAAHALSFDLRTGKAKIWRYWSLPQLATDTSARAVDESALLDELEVLLEDAVRQQMVADVPVGILLSGGVDSSLMTAMAVRQNRKVRTFSIGFPGHGKLDETPHARLIARHFGTEHTELMADPATADLLPRLAAQFDEPMVDSSMIPTCLVSQLVRQHCTVALGGDGGDELFGGYTHYSRLLWLQRRARYVPRALRRLLALGAAQLPVGFGGGNIRTWLMAAADNLDEDLPPIAHHFDAGTRRQLLRGVLDTYRPVAEDIRRAYMPREADLLQRATRMDFADYLAEDILVKVDRASMLNSLEIRAPFLDHRLIAFAFGWVPSALKATPTDKKILLKRLAARLLPAQFDQQRNQGFS